MFYIYIKHSEKANSEKWLSNEGKKFMFESFSMTEACRKLFKSSHQAPC